MLWTIGGIALLVGVGLSVELLRGNKVKTWVELEGGEFTPKGPVPEVAAVDSGSFRNIGRFRRGGVSYVVGESHWYRSSGIAPRDSAHGGSGTHVVCIAILPGRDLPALRVGPPRSAASAAMLKGMKQMAGRDLAGPAAIALEAPEPGFVEAFELRARDPQAAPDPAAVAALCTPTLQRALLAHDEHVVTVEMAGELLRVQVTTQQLKRNHAQALAAAEAIVAALPAPTGTGN